MTLKVRKLPVGQLKTNCYLVIDDEAAIIIDPGDDADYIIRVLQDENVTPTKIIATHGHFDHILAVTELKMAYQIPFLMHKKDEFLLKRMVSSARRFSGITSDPPPNVDKYLEDGESLKIARLHAPGAQATGGQGNYKLRIVSTPGHTPGSISLHISKAKVIFVGDLFFSDGSLGRYDFAYSKKEALQASLSKILKLPKDTIIYSGHGESATLKNIIYLFKK